MAKRQIAWDVFVPRGHKLMKLDTVFYTSDCDAEYVRKSLIGHDGYPSNIIVRPQS